MMYSGYRFVSLDIESAMYIELKHKIEWVLNILILFYLQSNSGSFNEVNACV